MFVRRDMFAIPGQQRLSPLRSWPTARRKRGRRWRSWRLARCLVRWQSAGSTSLPNSMACYSKRAAGRHAAVAFLGGRIKGRRQGLGEEFRRLADHAARHRDVSTRTSAHSAIRRPTGPSASTAFMPTSRTTVTSSNFRPAASARSTPRPASFRSTRRRHPTPGRGAAGWMRRTGCGSPNLAAMPSACSTPKLKRSPNTGIHCSGRRLTTSWPTATARHGRSTRPPIASAGSIRGPPRSPTTCCRATARRVFVDDRSNPVTVWIGNNLAASIVKIEPMD